MSTTRPLSKTDLKQRLQPIEADLRAFRSVFKETIATDVPLLNRVIGYMHRQKGKEIRPALVFMTARLFGPTTHATHVAGTMIELLHTATLIHDDVVDEADLRRNFTTIHRIWNNKVGVLLGDYLLSKGLSVALKEDQVALLKITSQAVEKMSEGELRQLKTTKLQTMTQERYYQIIEEKTASLLAACMESGALSVLDAPSEEALNAVHEAGIQIGLAFQIKDDLLDYQDKGMGKTKQHDLEERKVTLPLLKAMSNASPAEGKQVMRRFKKRKKSKQDIQWILRFVEDHHGIKESEQAMIQHVDHAIKTLQAHPNRRTDHDATTTMQEFEQLIDFVIYRSV